MIDLPDFTHHAAVPQGTVERYRDAVPAELVEVWERFGLGSFGAGFFRVIDPAVYEEALGAALGRVEGEGVAIPVFATGLADLICWEPGHGVIAIMYRNVDTRGLGTNLGTMLKLVRLEGIQRYAQRTLDWEMYPKAVTEVGPLGFDESFTYVPLLSLGGEKRIENMHKRKTVAAIQVYVDLQGVIEH